MQISPEFIQIELKSLVGGALDRCGPLAGLSERLKAQARRFCI